VRQFLFRRERANFAPAEPKLTYQYGKRNRHLILIVDINISNWGYQQQELSISTNCIVHIDNSNCRYWTILMYCNVQYLMSVMDVICWYRQFELLISTMLLVDVDNWYCQYQHVRAIIPIVDIDNWNYRYLYGTYIVDVDNYWQFQLSISIIYECNNSYCWYRKFAMLLWTVRIADIGNYLLTIV